MALDSKKYTERLDKIAEEVQQFSPALAYQIDKVADVLEGKKEASTLKFDADEARYMANRFNFNVRQQDTDEPYMKDFNNSNYEQVSSAYAKMPGHAGKSAEKVVEEKPAEKVVEEKKEASVELPYKRK